MIKILANETYSSVIAGFPFFGEPSLLLR